MPTETLCIWKIHPRHPDLTFLADVYAKLARWHAWWPQYRDGSKNGLLEWGSSGGKWQNTQYEIRWEDNVHFRGTKMVGTAMVAAAVDINTLYAMDPVPSGDTQSSR